ncbi:MAG: GTPase RsgA, partial [Spirochaetota bacterium]
LAVKTKRAAKHCRGPYHRTSLSRYEAGRRSAEQVLAANVDTALLLQSLEGGRQFSIGLVERMLSMCTAGSVEPLIVLTKSDLAKPATRETWTEETSAQMKGPAGDTSKS